MLHLPWHPDTDGIGESNFHRACFEQGFGRCHKICERHLTLERTTKGHRQGHLNRKPCLLTIAYHFPGHGHGIRHPLSLVALAKGIGYRHNQTGFIQTGFAQPAVASLIQDQTRVANI